MAAPKPAVDVKATLRGEVLPVAEIGPLLDKYFSGRPDISTADRVRILRLIENMTVGRNAVGYLTESLHGAGSPQAQRIVIERTTDLEAKKRLAARLAGIAEQ